jgi:predicted PurR-regulated permease PerM
MASRTMLLTAALFFLLVAIVAGVFTFLVKNTLMPILFAVSLVMFVWAGITYMRERRRGTRR